MPKARDFISRVRSLNKLINADNNITDRVILKELKSCASLLIKRETNLRRLWNSPNLFTPIECIKMIEVPLSECCDYISACKVARSEKKIPQISEGIFGLLIQTVFSPGKRKFDYASVDRFVNILKLGIKNTNKYFWFQNDYLYVSDHQIENVDLYAYFDDDNFNPSDYSECKGKNQGNTNNCINPLDRDLAIPSYLEKSLVDLVNETLNNTYFRHTVDQTPDKNDTQDKK